MVLHHAILIFTFRVEQLKTFNFSTALSASSNYVGHQSKFRQSPGNQEANILNTLNIFIMNVNFSRFIKMGWVNI